MASAQVVKTSVFVKSNRSFQNCTNTNDHCQKTTDTPGLKQFTKYLLMLQVDLTEPILSRFDILCVVKDTVDPVQVN